MAAIDLFDNYTAGLSVREREQLKGLIDNTGRDLLASRSEEARVRVVNDFIRESHASLEGDRPHWNGP